MNHIFKTVLNKTTGKIIVVSEKTSSNNQSQQSEKIAKTQSGLMSCCDYQIIFNKNNLAVLVVGVLTACLSSMSYAQNYVGSEQLILASDLGKSFESLLDGGIKKGVIVSNTGGLPSIENAVLNIDYATGPVPEFVVAGYGLANIGAVKEDMSVLGNKITLKKGDINGNLYAGLTHITQVTEPDCSDPTVVCSQEVEVSKKMLTSTQNTIDLFDQHSIKINGDMNAGYARIDLLYKDIISLDSSTDSDASAKVSIIGSTNHLDSNANMVSITGSKHILNNINSGYSGLNLQYGTVRGGMADGLTKEAVSSSSSAFADISSNSLSSNNNVINVVGDSHKLNDINVGHTGINLQYGNFVAGTIDGSTSLSTTFSTNVNAINQVNTFNNIFYSSENKITISGLDHVLKDIKSGSAEFAIGHGDFTASQGGSMVSYSDGSVTSMVNSSKNTFNSNKNMIFIDGMRHKINDIDAGSARVDIHYGDLKASSLIAGSFNSSPIANSTVDLDISGSKLISNENMVSITGDKHTFNNINIGYSGINAKYGDLIGGVATAFSGISNGNANAKLNISGNIFNSNNNKMSVSGEGYEFNDINVGYAGMSLQYSDLKAGKGISISGTGNANVDVEANAFGGNLISNVNMISFVGNGHKSNDLNAGHTVLELYYGDLTAGSSANFHKYDGQSGNGMANTNIYVNASENIFDSSQNKISITGNSNSFNDFAAGHTKLNLQYGNISGGTTKVLIKNERPAYVEASISKSTFTSDENKIFALGRDNKFNNIDAGYVGLNLRYGNITGETTIINDISTYDNISLNIDLTDTAISASKNNINLNGDSIINGNIHTGYIDFNIEHGKVQKADGTEGELSVALSGTKAYAMNNILTIEGQHGFTSPETKIYGGYLSYNKDLGYKPETYDVFTGNTLNYANRIPITIKEIGNFQTYNFALDPEQNKEIAMITADKISLGTNSDNFSNASQQLSSDVFVTGIHSGKALSTGTEFLLMQGNIDGNGLGHDTAGVEQKDVQQGISLLYNVKTKVDADTGRITATIVSGHDEPDSPDPKVNPQLKSLLEGNLAGLMLLTRSADNLAYNTFSAITEQNQKKGLVPFVQMSGHHARYNSGSHIDANGGLLTAGISFQNDNLTLAIFSENGWDSYDSHNTFSDVAKVDATGNNRFNGGGIYGHYNFNNGLYTDASFRAGHLHTSYKTNDIRNATTGESASYKVDGGYLSAHAGIGYQFKIDSLNHFDLNLKYLWTGTKAHDLVVAGDEIHFDKLNSHRLRLNGENSYQFNPNWSLLYGAGIEYEFDGKAEGTTYRIFSLNAPSVEGLTGIGSLGVRFQPVSNKNLTIDFKGQGYLGERDGGGALLHMQYAF